MPSAATDAIGRSAATAQVREEMKMPSYAVTGASGRLGRLAVAELLARGVPASDVVAVVHSRARAADLADRGVRVREADYSSPGTLVAALAGVERLLLVSSSEAGQRVAHHVNAWCTENYTDQIGRYLEAGEIVGAAGTGRISAAARRDYAAAAAAALLEDEAGNRAYELGGRAFGLPGLARTVTGATGAPVTYRDLPAGEYASRLQRAGLDEATARFVAAPDASIARGDLQTSSQDLARLRGHPRHAPRRGRGRSAQRRQPRPDQSGGG